MAQRAERTAAVVPPPATRNTLFWIKEPHSPTYVGWHQDLKYWGLDNDELASVWVALSPATTESGCMSAILGSNRMLLDHGETYHDHNMLTRGQELTMHYMPTHTRQTLARWDTAALVRGTDTYGHFEHTPRPQRDFDPAAVAFHARASKAMREIVYSGAKESAPKL